MSVFMHLMGEYVWRWLADRPYRKPEVLTTGFAEGVPRVMTREMKLLMTGICASTVLVYLRLVLLGLQTRMRTYRLCLPQVGVPRRRVRQRIQRADRAQPSPVQ